MFKKIFIVDDDAVSIFLTEAILAMEQIASEYSTFSSAKEALMVLTQSMDGTSAEPLPQLILLDLNMPVMSGWDMLEALLPYEQQLLGQVEVLILTSSVDEQEIKRATEYKLVTDFLQKPLDEGAIRKLKKLD
ncbi:response regulator [Pontibacter liquoris]|uniref:response regulator n=1 Tax=Pontibacter liquoris TaxID=2905677 RepID=UPI001FA717DF|nr:response regulator [Pontibacter liquoris]